MHIPRKPPKIRKSPLLDDEFGDWWLTVNRWGVAGFVLFLGCLGAGDYKHFCALLSAMLMSWNYYSLRDRLPRFVRRLRSKSDPDAAKMENEIYVDHIVKIPLAYFPFFLGVATLGWLVAWPAVNQNWGAYLPM